MNAKTINQNKLIITTFLVLTLIFLMIGFVDAECVPDGGRWEKKPSECCNVACQDGRCVGSIPECGICGCENTPCATDTQCCPMPQCGLASNERLICQSGFCKKIDINNGGSSSSSSGGGGNGNDKKSNFDMKTILIIGGIGLIVYALFSGGKKKK